MTGFIGFMCGLTVGILTGLIVGLIMGSKIADNKQDKVTQ